MATATGPTDATAACRVFSSPCGRRRKLEQLPALPLTEYRHIPVWRGKNFYLDLNSDFFNSEMKQLTQQISKGKLAGDLVFIGVEALRVDASVADDVAVGLGDGTSPATPVSLAAAAV